MLAHCGPMSLCSNRVCQGATDGKRRVVMQMFCMMHLAQKKANAQSVAFLMDATSARLTFI